MNTKLITALRASANALDNGTFTYDWNYSNQCNCGILACAIMGKSATEMKRIVELLLPAKGRPTWTNLVGENCPVTGIPTSDLFKSLLSHGLSAEDMIDLERLSNHEICERMNLPVVTPKSNWWQRSKQPKREDIDHTSARHVALYMRAWADILTEQGADDAPQERRAELEEAHHEG